MFMEPFRIKAVEPIPLPSAEQRSAALRNAAYNVFGLHSEDVTIDLLTDSGTGAMSASQWSALMKGDEAYAGAASFEHFESAVRELTGFPHVLPTHQGRGAERVLFSLLLDEGAITVSNGHFDTTTANVKLAGGEPMDLPCEESKSAESDFPFKGNLNLEELEELLAGDRGGDVAAVILTLTENASGGHPVSPANARRAREICEAHGLPLLLDAARFAENAYLVTQRDPDYREKSVREVAREFFGMANGAWCSLKKDGFGNIGAFLALEDEGLADRCRELIIATEGFPTYGGLSGRDLEALAAGIEEATDPHYLAYRAAGAEWLANALDEVGVPVVQPPGCHAVYVDAGRLLPHLKPQELPGVSLSCELYLAGGIRAAEMGTLAMGHPDPDGGPDAPAPRELLRLALPRRVYTRSHLEYVVHTAAGIVERAAELPAYRITSQPKQLRHFSASLAPISGD